MFVQSVNARLVLMADALALELNVMYLKQQVGRLAFEWNVSEFIDQEQVVAFQGSQLAIEQCLMLCRD